MKRLLLLLIPVFLTASCTTAPDDVILETDADETPTSESQIPEPTVANEVTFELVNPVDPTRITTSEVLFAGLTSAGVLTALEIELVEGPLIRSSPETPFELIAAESLSVADRRVRLPLSNGEAFFSIPAGIIDGERYGVRVRGVLSDDRVTVWEEVSTEIDLRLPPPELSNESETIDTTPRLRLIDSYSARAVSFALFREGELVAQISSAGRDGSVTGELRPGAYQVSAQAVTEGGIVSRAGPWSDLVVLSDASPVPIWPVDAESLGPAVGLHWQELSGAARFEIRYREQGDSAWQEIPGDARTYVQIPDLMESGRAFEWQVRAQNDAGRWFAWSTTTRFTVGDLALEFVPVVSRDARVTFEQGYDEGSRDEQPARQVTLSIPFEAMVLPLTNAELVRIVSAGVTSGMFEILPDGVWSRTADRLIVGTGELEYGNQFGLRIDGDALVVREGYESHPATGISWYGAGEIANLLSFAAGIDSAYVTEESRFEQRVAGYRLPTEAEWEYTARGTDDRLLPWNGRLSGSAANYFRSSDPFEDFADPFSDNGGPTTPVGFFDGSERGGFETVSNASPFGVLDMVGNVWEWTADRYDADWYSNGSVTDPRGPGSANADDDQPGTGSVVLAAAFASDQRVVRGTAWNTRADDVRLTNRGRYNASGTSYSIGLRLVRHLQE
jgi:formylglycine-generating enzyme required for sulfatase activity